MCELTDSRLKGLLKANNYGVSIAVLARREGVPYHTMRDALAKYKRRMRRDQQHKNNSIARAHMEHTIRSAILKLGIENQKECVRDFLMSRMEEARHILDTGIEQ